MSIQVAVFEVQHMPKAKRDESTYGKDKINELQTQNNKALSKEEEQRSIQEEAHEKTERMQT